MLALVSVWLVWLFMTPTLHGVTVHRNDRACRACRNDADGDQSEPHPADAQTPPTHPIRVGAAHA